MATELGDGHKHRRRRRSESHRRHESHDQPDPIMIVDDEFSKPADAAALRAARLNSMAIPATDRKKMKGEYMSVRPARTVTTKSRTPVVSSGLLGRRSTVSSTRPKPTTVTEQKGSGERVYQYVYNSQPGSNEEETSEELKQEMKKTKPSLERHKTVSEKPKAHRRKTEPITVRRSSTTTSRPQVKKSNTSVKDFAYKAESGAESGKPQPQRNSSIFGALFTKPPPPPEKRVSCLTCGSDDVRVSKSAKLPCSHRMCQSCLKRIFEMSVKDPAHMPPRCCTSDAIKLRHVEHLFNDDFKKTWNRKFKEYNAKNRIYCPRRGCGEWIQPKHFKIEQGRKIGVCSKCKFSVCATCNQKAHRSRECPKDPAMKQLSEMAEQKGWVKCYNCSAMVELKEGCNHMTCRCMAEFCMVCGLKWKSCDCPWFNYEAVDDLRGNPIRYQQEMDRRREQLQQDEEIARQMAGLGFRGGRRRAHEDGQLDQDAFLQQARDALTARYQNGEAAARGLLGGWLTPDPPTPVMPGAFEDRHQPPLQDMPVIDLPPPRRRTYRLRHAGLGEI